MRFLVCAHTDATGCPTDIRFESLEVWSEYAYVEDGSLRVDDRRCCAIKNTKQAQISRNLKTLLEGGGLHETSWNGVFIYVWVFIHHFL